MEAHNENSNLWNKNENNRENGAILIGSFIRSPCPLPISQYTRCDIAMIKSHHTVILLKNPVSIPTLPMNNEIEANTSLSFVHNSTQLTDNFYNPIKISSSVNLCDRQRAKDWLNIKGYGCYGMSTKITSLVIHHAISVQTVQHSRF